MNDKNAPTYESLKERISELENLLSTEQQRKERRKKRQGWLVKLGIKAILGGSVVRNFNFAWDKWEAYLALRDKQGHQWPSNETRNFLGALVSRFTRFGMVGLILGAMPIMLLLWQTELFRAQNKKFDFQNQEFLKQNEVIQKQFLQAELFERRRELNQELLSIIDNLSPIKNPNKDLPSLTPLQIARISNLCRDAIWWDPILDPHKKSNIRGSLLTALVKINVQVSGYNFAKSDLNRIDLWSSVLIRVNLMEADLKEADLRGANLEEADLRGANLEGANLEGAILKGANLQGAILKGANLQEAILEGANLQEAILVEANLGEVNLRGVDLRGVYLRRGDLRRGALRGVDLRGVALRGADLRGVDLRETDLSQMDLRGVNLQEAILVEAILVRTILVGANLAGANLAGANLAEANLAEANLAEANLAEAILYFGDLKGADLTSVDLKDFYGIEGANIQGVVGAPEGFREWALEMGAVEMELEEFSAYKRKMTEQGLLLVK